MRSRLSVALALTFLLSASMLFASGEAEKSAPSASVDAKEYSLPLKEKVTLTYWQSFAPGYAPFIKNYNDLLFYQWMEERTGVHLEFIHTSGAQAKEQFNLMLASREFPDIYDGHLINDYPGGPEKAISDGFIIPLNDLMAKYAPNLTIVYKILPHIAKYAVTDNSTHYMFPMLNNSDKFGDARGGSLLRGDMLKELGLAVPETVGEWETVLNAFKSRLAMKIPLSLAASDLQWENFVSAYNVGSSWYVDGGVAKFGPYETGYKEFLGLFNRWYREGLLDPNFATITEATKRNQMSTGVSAASVGGAGDMKEIWLPVLAKDPQTTFQLVAAPIPVLTKGARPFLGRVNSAFIGHGAHLTTKNRNREISALWLDSLYTKEASWLMNLGKEGVTYVMEKGLVKNWQLDAKGNPVAIKDLYSWSPTRARHPGFRGMWTGKEIVNPASIKPPVPGQPAIQVPFPFDERVAAGDYAAYPGGMWKNFDFDRFFPPVYYTKEESSRMAAIMNEVQTYQQEMMLKMVMGVEPLSKWEEYKNTLRRMGIEEAQKIQQAALTRFLAR